MQMQGVIVTSQIQAFAESVRLAFRYTGSLIAVTCSAFLFKYLYYSSIAFIVGNSAMLLIMVFKRKSFRDPNIVI